MEAMQPAPEMRKLQPMVAPQHRRYTEPHKRHGKLNHSLSDSALMLDPWRDGVILDPWKDSGTSNVDPQQRLAYIQRLEEMRLEALHKSLSGRSGLSSPTLRPSAPPAAPAADLLAVQQPSPVSAADLRRRRKLHQTLSDSFIVFDTFRLKSAAWLKFVTKKWIPVGGAGCKRDLDTHATLIQAWCRGFLVRLGVRTPSTGRTLRLNLRRRKVCTQLPDGGMTPITVTKISPRLSPSAGYLSTVMDYGTHRAAGGDPSFGPEPALVNFRLDSSPADSPAESAEEMVLEEEPSVEQMVIVGGGLESTPNSGGAPPSTGDSEEADSGTSPVSFLSFSFVSSVEQVEVMLCETPTKAATLHADLKATRFGSHSPSAPSNAWLQAWDKDIKQLEKTRVDRNSPKAPPKKLPKPKKKARAATVSMPSMVVSESMPSLSAVAAESPAAGMKTSSQQPAAGGSKPPRKMGRSSSLEEMTRALSPPRDGDGSGGVSS